jgi:hypothetical protein
MYQQIRFKFLAYNISSNFYSLERLTIHLRHEVDDCSIVQ